MSLIALAAMLGVAVAPVADAATQADGVHGTAAAKPKKKRRRAQTRRAHCHGKLKRRRRRSGAKHKYEMVCVKPPAHHAKKHGRKVNSAGKKAGGSSGIATSGASGAPGAASSSVAAGADFAPTALAPSVLTEPSISGAIAGSVLRASPGSWSGSPVSYAYQWQACEAGEASCQSIEDATSASYRVTSTDVGDTIKVTVTATNLLGSSTAASAATAPVSSPATPTAPTNCANVPSACGYPDATDSGVPAGSSLSSRSEEMHVSAAGSTIKDLALTGTIYVEANNVTIEDSEVLVDGSQTCSGSCGGKGIWVAPGVSGTTIKDVTCRGGAASGANVTQYCVMSNSSSTKVEGSRMYDCTECYTGPGTLVNSFLENNGEIPGEHYEDIYYGGGEGALVANHDTMLDPHSQTAVVFASVDFGNQETLSIENNLLAGGGYVIYGGGSGSGGKVLGPVTVKDNRFSREFYPNGGSYGIDAYMNEAVTTWSGNYWDETLEPVPEEGEEEGG